MAVADKLNELITQRNNLADNLNTMGVEASQDEKLSTLIPKVLDIKASGGEDEELVKSFMSTIDSSLGSNCTKLPDGIELISDYAFYRCANLALTELPNSITSIGSSAFYHCDNMYITKLPVNLITLGASSFRYCYKLDIKEIPIGITVIPDMCFQDCIDISELTCYGVITSIGAASFSGCGNLKKIILPNVTSVPTLTNTTIFNSTPIHPAQSRTGYIYVPDTLLENFKKATNWSYYSSQIKGISELEG